MAHEKDDAQQENRTTDELKDLFERVVSLVAQAFATKLVYSAVSVAALIIGGYFFIVDRTLDPLSERVASLELTSNERLLSVEEAIRQQSATLARIDERLIRISNQLIRVENSFSDELTELKVGTAQGIVEQRAIAERLAKLEAKINGLQPTTYDADELLDIPVWPKVFESIDLEAWTVDVVATDAGNYLLVLKSVPEEIDVPVLREPLLDKPDCSELWWVSYEDGNQTLQGFVPTEADKTELANTFSPEAVQKVAILPRPKCSIGQALATAALPSDSPAVRLLSNVTSVSFGDSLALEITTPNFPSFVYVFYIDTNHAVLNLNPYAGPIRELTPPRNTFVLGDGMDGRQVFSAAPPEGTELVAVLASEFALSEFEVFEGSSEEFVTMLGSVFDEFKAGARPGARISSSILALEIVQ